MCALSRTFNRWVNLLVCFRLLNFFNVLVFLLFFNIGFFNLLFSVLLVSRLWLVRFNFQIDSKLFWDFFDVSKGRKNLVTKQCTIHSFVKRSWTLKVLIIHVRSFRRVNSYVVTSSLIFGDCLTNEFTILCTGSFPHRFRKRSVIYWIFDS